uniref:c-Myc-binding protein n=1 Tax=Oryza glumipatula TaxID=40148 RepID=A0A0E0AGM2_9ORYZ
MVAHEERAVVAKENLPSPPLLAPPRRVAAEQGRGGDLHLASRAGERIMDREAKKEAFRKYLESSGVLDTLTKVLVALYEENDKPSSAVEFVQQKLGGPSISDYEKLKAEKLDLQLKYNELLETHKETCRQLDELKNLKNGSGNNTC